MKIIYNQNPLKTKVGLSELDLANMRNKLKIEQIYNEIFESYYKVDNIDTIKLTLEILIDSEDNEDSKINKEVERLISYYVQELTQGYSHLGDCTKVCCSCTKCNAEDTLGINTLEGLVCLSYIDSAFDKPDTTLSQAIENLSSPSKSTEDWHAPYIDSWNIQRIAALESLKKYRDKHFPN